MKPKILVGCPTYEGRDYCLNQYIGSVKELTYSNYDILLVDNSKTEDYFNRIRKMNINVIKGCYKEGANERIVNSRNVLRDKVLKGGYDYLLSLEQDVIPPLNVIESLLRHNKEVVSGIYYNYFKKPDGKRLLQPLVYKELIEQEKEKLKWYKDIQLEEGPLRRQCTSNEVEGGELIKLKACGLGCVLIHRDVLEKVKFRYELNKNCFDDMYFCGDAGTAGFEIYADTSVKCKHMVLGRKKEESWEVLKR